MSARFDFYSTLGASRLFSLEAHFAELLETFTQQDVGQGRRIILSVPVLDKSGTLDVVKVSYSTPQAWAAHPGLDVLRGIHRVGAAGYPDARSGLRCGQRRVSIRIRNGYRDAGRRLPGSGRPPSALRHHPAGGADVRLPACHHAATPRPTRILEDIARPPARRARGKRWAFCCATIGVTATRPAAPRQRLTP